MVSPCYTGPFTRRTGSPVLVVGNFWDPATNDVGDVQPFAPKTGAQARTRGAPKRLPPITAPTPFSWAD